MVVGVALFEIHIGHAQSLKEKRMVVKSLRDKIRRRFEVSAAEVGLQELHQRARLGVSAVALDGSAAERMLASIRSFVEEHQEASLIGWTQEMFDFDADAPLGIPGVNWSAGFSTDEEDTTDQ